MSNINKPHKRGGKRDGAGRKPQGARLNTRNQIVVGVGQLTPQQTAELLKIITDYLNSLKTAP